MVRDGYLAVEDGLAVGFAAVDLAGSIPLVLVTPGHQGRGIGTGLLSAALDRLRAAGVSTVHAGSGGTDCIWPGVPLDLPGAVRLFTARGWHAIHDTLDLVADLPDYPAPALASGSAARAGLTITPAAAADLAAVVAFEEARFPNWARWFRAGNRDALLARDSAGTIAATLLLDGPGADTVYGPMLGPAAATISCVGVAPRWKDAASAPPWWHARRKYCATAARAPATSAGRSASRSISARDTSPGAATACSARPPALTRLRLPLAQHDLRHPHSVCAPPKPPASDRRAAAVTGRWPAALPLPRDGVHAGPRQLQGRYRLGIVGPDADTRWDDPTPESGGPPPGYTIGISAGRGRSLAYRTSSRVAVRPISIRWISDVPSKIVKILAVAAVSAGKRPSWGRGISANSARPVRIECRFPSGPRLVSSVVRTHVKSHRESHNGCPLGGLLRRGYVGGTFWRCPACMPSVTLGWGDGDRQWVEFSCT
jgi:hypothetical protein